MDCVHAVNIEKIVLNQMLASCCLNDFDVCMRNVAPEAGRRHLWTKISHPDAHLFVCKPA